MTDRQGNYTIGVIMWLGMLSVSFYNFQPLLVGGIVTALGLSEAQAGLIATANMFGVCVGLAIATLWIHKWATHRTVLCAFLLMGFGSLVSAYTPSFGGLALVRFFAGFGEGLALACAVSTIALFAKPDRIFALVMVGMSLYGMVGLLVLPYIIDAYSLPGVFIFIACLSLIGLPLYRSLPDHDAEDEQRAGSLRAQLSVPVILVLASLMIVYVSTNGVWTYYERIGVSIGVSHGDIGVALSAGLFASMIGGLLAAILSDRYGRLRPVISGLVLAATSIAILYVASDFTPYTLSVMLLFGATGFVVPYYMGALAQFDQSGRLPVVGYLIVFVGNFVGPAMAAGLVKPGMYATLMTVAALLFLLALLLVGSAFLAATRNARQAIPDR